MPKRPPIVSRHRQSITPATRFRQLPVWVSRADIVAYFKVDKVDAQALIDSAARRCRIDGVLKISKYQLQAPPYPDLIAVMQQHPSRRSIRRLFRAEIDKILCDPSHPNTERYRRVREISARRCAMSTVNGALLGVKAAAAYLGGTERWLRRLLERDLVPCKRIGRNIYFKRVWLDEFIDDLPGITPDRPPSMRKENRHAMDFVK